MCVDSNQCDLRYEHAHRTYVPRIVDPAHTEYFKACPFCHLKSYSHCHQVLDEDVARVLLRRAGFASERIDDIIGSIPDAVPCMCR